MTKDVPKYLAQNDSNWNQMSMFNTFHKDIFSSYFQFAGIIFSCVLAATIRKGYETV